MVLFDEFVHSFWAISTAYLMLVVYFIVFSVIWKRRKKTTNSFCFLFTCAPFWKSQTRVVRVCCFALLCFVDSLTAIELSSLYVMCTTTTLVWTRLHVKKKPIHNYHVIACFYTLILSVHNHHRATHKPRKKKKTDDEPMETGNTILIHIYEIIKNLLFYDFWIYHSHLRC